MKREKLEVEKRTVLGKKVKKLRRDGILPGNVYGKGIQSEAVQLPLKAFEPVFKDAGETGLVDLQLDGQVRPVLIHNIQTDPVSGQRLHVDFYQVNLKEKIKAMVPVELTGEPKAVTDKVGLVLQTLSEIEVEALPEALPEKFEVTIEHLASVDDHVSVSDLKAPEGVEILTEPSQVIVKISELVSEEAKEQAAEEAAAAEAAKVEGAEGEAEPAEGAEVPAEEAPKGEEAQPAPQKEEQKPKE